MIENDEEIEPTTQRENPGPGARLRAARLQHGLEVADVAGRLHLRQYIIEAVEANNFAALSSAVFVRGYLKSYARLVGESEQEILCEYDRCHSGSKPRVDNVRVVQTRNREVDISHGTIRFINIGAILVSVVLAGIWGFEHFTGQRIVKTAPEVSQETTVDSTLSQPTVSAEIVTESATPATNAVSSSRDLQALVNSVEAVPVPEITRISTSNTQAAEEDGIVVEFLGSSWVDIRDASGEYKLLGDMKRGDRHLLGGRPPYQVVLSNAEAVSLRIKGIPYDLSPHRHGAAARFTLGEEAAPAAVDALEGSGLSLELLADCWVEVKDASGEFKLSGTLKKGEKHPLRGKPPYKMTFGNGDKVRLLVDGRPFDHSRYIKGAVARFTYPTQR